MHTNPESIITNQSSKENQEWLNIKEVADLMSDIDASVQPRFLEFVINKMSTSSEALKEQEELEMPTYKKIKGIRQRVDSRWEGRFMYKGKTVSVFAHTQKECKRKYDKAKRDAVRNHTLGTKNSLKTLNEWFYVWLETFNKKIREQSKIEKETRYKKYIKPTLGTKKLKLITTIELQDCLNNIPFESQKRRAYRELKGLFYKAQVSDLIDKNPMLGVDDLSEVESKDTKVLSEETHKEFISFLREEHKELSYALEFVSYTGLRLGEVSALEINDIHFNLDKPIISVNKSMNKKTGEIGPPKTKQSYRDIPLLEKAAECIKEYIKEYKPKDRLFYNFSSSTLSNAARRYTKKYGLKGVSMQSFRVYFISYCATIGIDLKVRQKWAGHKDERITNNVYTGIQPSLELKSIEMFNTYGI